MEDPTRPNVIHPSASETDKSNCKQYLPSSVRSCSAQQKLIAHFSHTVVRLGQVGNRKAGHCSSTAVLPRQHRTLRIRRRNSKRDRRRNSAAVRSDNGVPRARNQTVSDAIWSTRSASWREVNVELFRVRMNRTHGE